MSGRQRDVSVGVAAKESVVRTAAPDEVPDVRGLDASAFTELLREYDDRMRAVAYNMVGSGAAMDDVLQTAYLKAWTSRDRFRGDARFSTWLHRIVINCCIDHLRAVRRVEPVEAFEVETAEAHGTPVAFEARFADADSIGRALAALGDDQRAAVLLVDGEGMTYPEAAEVLGVAEGTVGSRVSRARAELRRFLRDEGVSR